MYLAVLELNSILCKEAEMLNYLYNSLDHKSCSFSFGLPVIAHRGQLIFFAHLLCEPADLAEPIGGLKQFSNFPPINRIRDRSVAFNRRTQRSRCPMFGQHSLVRTAGPLRPRPRPPKAGRTLREHFALQLLL